MIRYLLGLDQNQFNSIFQGPMSELYPSNFNSDYWNYSDFSWDQSYTYSLSNWSSIGPSLSHFEFNNNQEALEQ